MFVPAEAGVTASVRLADSVPDQLPDAVQLVTSMAFQVRLAELTNVIEVGLTEIASGLTKSGFSRSVGLLVAN